MGLNMRRAYKARKKIGTVTQTTCTPSQQAQIVSAVSGTTTIVVTFDQPIILSGFPETWITRGMTPNHNPISAAKTGTKEITLTFDTNISTATGLDITPLDHAVRTPSGGFVQATTVAVT